MLRLLPLAAALGVLPAKASAPAPARGSEPAENARLPAVAGQFYPADPKARSAMARGFLSAITGESEPRASLDVIAILAPHAGLRFSGAVAAKAFRAAPKDRYDSILVVGAGHYRAVRGAAIYPGIYQVPGFAAPYDAELALALMKASPLISADPQAHAREHSVEVELPFIAERWPKAKLVAMVMNTDDLSVIQDVGRAIARAVRGKKVLLVASSDLAHYPSAVVADAVDQTTLEALRAMDPAYFWLTNRLILERGLADLDVSYCGQAAVAAVLTAAKELGATTATLLSRASSADAGGGADHVVGYAAVAFGRAFGAPGESGSAKPDQVFGLDGAAKKELLAAARASIADYLTKERAPAPGFSRDPRFNLPAAVFVTLKKNGELRGCIGSLEARESLLESVARNAVQAAVVDPRFKPLTPDELGAVRLEISVLSPAKNVPGAGRIRRGDGVILEKNGHAGVFLPQVWEDLPNKSDFLKELCAQKAGLPRDCYKDPATRFKVFSVDSFEE